MKRKRADWSRPLNDEEAKFMKEVFIWLYKGYAQCGDNQFTDAVIAAALREATRLVGIRRNTKISKKAHELLELPGADAKQDYKTLEKVVTVTI